MHQAKLRVLSMLMLTCLLTVNVNAVDIPILSFTCTQPKTATGSCVQGYFASGWASSSGYWEYTMNTTAFTGVITVNFRNARSSASGPTSGSVYYQTIGPEVFVGNFSVSTSCANVAMTLPAGCSGQPNLRVKVRMTGATNSGASHRIDSSKVFDASLASCSGTPTAGSITGGGTTICSGSSTLLTLTGASPGAGISYRWQSSPNNMSFTDIPGATSLSYTAVPASTTYYRVIVTCTGSGLNATTASATVTVQNVSVAPITGYTPPLLVGSTQSLSNTTPGGTWTSSNENAITVDPVSGIMTGEFGGTAIVTYAVTDGLTGCIGTSSITVNAIWPHTLALYAGVNGASTGVINVAGDQAGPLYATGFGAATPCGSGGKSGMTVNVADSIFTLSGPRVGYFVYPDAGKALNMYRIEARTRVSASGPQRAAMGYRIWNNGTAGSWTTSTTVNLSSGNCGTNTNTWDFNSGFPENPNPTIFGIIDSLEVALFPYKPVSSTGTFQLNTLEVYGIVTTDVPCNNGSITTTADSALPAAVNICDSGSSSLTYNLGTGGIAGVDIFLQWEESADGINWNPISGAEGVVYQTPTFVAGVSAPVTYYRVAVFCAASGTTEYSAVSVVRVAATPVSGGTLVTGIAPSIPFPMKHMLLGSTYSLSSTIPGGTWSSNDTSVIKINTVTSVATPQLPGDAIITYRVLVNGCPGISRDTVAAYYPGTKALYIGKNGNSTAVYAASGTTATPLSLANWGSGTACGGGGISGLTNTVTTQNIATNGRVSTTVSNISGTSFSITAIRATLRKQLSGTYKAYLGYKPSSGSTWTFSAPVDVETDDCGYSHNELAFAATGVNINPAASYDFAVFGYNGAAFSTLQLNTLSILGTGPQLINGKSSLSENHDVRVYPNPATNIVNVSATQKINVIILSVEGKKLIEQKDARSIDISGLVSGMYLIQVYGENNGLLKTEKLVKD